MEGCQCANVPSGCDIPLACAPCAPCAPRPLPDRVADHSTDNGSRNLRVTLVLFQRWKLIAWPGRTEIICGMREASRRPGASLDKKAGRVTRTCPGHSKAEPWLNFRPTLRPFQDATFDHSLACALTASFLNGCLSHPWARKAASIQPPQLP